MVTTSGRIPAISLIASLLLISNLYAFWGLRDFPINTADSLVSVLTVENLLLEIEWNEFEPEDDRFVRTKLDSFITKLALERGYRSPVLQIDPRCAWATDNEYTAPNDLDTETGLANPIPRHGYSESLYDMVSEILLICEQQIDPDWPFQMPKIYLVFGRDIDINWVVTDSTMQEDLDNYVRCLKTVIKAVDDFAAQDEDRENYNVVWGEINLAPVLEDYWWNYCQSNPDDIDSILVIDKLFNQRIPFEAETFDQFSNRITSMEFQRKLVWANRLARESRTVDWYNFRFTFKPSFLKDVIIAFDNLVAGAGGWHEGGFGSTYAALELVDGAETGYSDSLIATDFSRRWSNGVLQNMEFIFLPLISNPERHQYGLLDEGDHASRVLNAYQVIPFRGIWSQDLIGRGGSIRNGIAMIFEEAVWPDNGADVRSFYWFNRQDDFDTTSEALGVMRLGLYDKGALLNVYGDTLLTYNAGDSISIPVGTTPIQVYTFIFTGEVEVEKQFIAKDFGINSIYPNPFNSDLTVEIEVKSPGRFALELVGLNGRTVSKRNLNLIQPGKRNESFSLPDLPSGEYLVRLRNRGESVGRKVVLLK